MIQELTDSQIEETRLALLGEESSRLIDLIFRMNLSLPLGHDATASIESARRLGWIAGSQELSLTELGWLVADPLREYRFWQERGRRTHGEQEHALLAPENYEGKSVLEVGSGYGCNLFSLQYRASGDFVGVEPMAIYRQFTPILAAREGLNTPEVHDGTGESLPFQDGIFDIVLCYSSHQYMDIKKALIEMTRVLRQGGQLQIIGGTLDSYVAGILPAGTTRLSLSQAWQAARTLVNTTSYQWLGSRVWRPSSASFTAAPVYPSKNAMLRWMMAAGLKPRHDLMKRVGHETCFVADRK